MTTIAPGGTAAPQAAGGAPKPETPLLATELQTLKEEFTALWGETKAEAIKPDDRDSYWAAAAASPATALCLSGGGIRSATFALGVLQALAQAKVLQEFHYLSTVSGGGYIGSWLSRWIEEAKGSVPTVEAALAQSIDRRPEQPALRELRENSNYLTPQAGMFTTDTWTALVIVVRNVVLNWLVIVPALMLVAMAPTVLASFAAILPAGSGLWFYAAGAGFLAVATCYAYSQLPGSLDMRPKRKTIAVVGAGFVLLWAFLLPLAYAPLAQDAYLDAPFPLWSELFEPSSWFNDRPVTPVLWSALAAFAGLVAAELYRRRATPAILLVNIAIAALIAFLSIEILALGAYLYASVEPRYRLDLIITCGPLWGVLTALIATTLFVGLRKVAVGGEHDREWLGRLSAVKVMPGLLWLVLAALCLLVPQAVFEGQGILVDLTSGLVAVISAPIAVLGGRSPKAILAKVATPAERRRALPLNLIVTVASYLFLAALVVLLARAESELALRLHRGIDLLSAIVPAALGLLAAHVIAAAILVAIVALTALRINVNRYSMHALYRNRLVRAYLGAPRRNRKPDTFTGLDFADDTRVAQLVSKSAAGKRCLFHVINACANLSGGRGSIAQERQALSFTITPLRCGGADLSPHGAYADAGRYGSSEPNVIVGSKGIHLGTAMTISGAAANSSMGYHSSPATALLLTMFNVRLGAWLPNPGWRPNGETHLSRSGPGFALRPLFLELLGRVTTDSKYLQLSDGGHFENLGIYEMVRRRCRVILVSDAGCDPKAHFEDLGNAVRRCRIDFGVDITFDDFRVTSRADGNAYDRAYAVGKINYPGEKPGVLVYLKPTFHQIIEFARRMPIDVGHYAAEHADFPHETTADQWFSESQFETYRQLGLQLTAEMLHALGQSGFGGGGGGG